MNELKKLRIAINVRFLLKNKLEGIGVFTYEALKKMVSSHPEVEFIFIFDRPFSPEFIFAPNIKTVVLPPPARHPFLWYAWFQLSVNRYLEKIKPDLFVSMDGYLPLRTTTKCLTIIHDLAFEHYPKDVPFLVRKYYRYFFPKFAKQAQRIATVSAFSKQDIVDYYQVSPSKIDVVYNGASEKFKPLSTEEKQEVKTAYTGGSEYFFYVGALHQRKNIGNLLKAFDAYKSNGGNNKLLISGRKAWGNSKMESIYENLSYKNDVIFTGWVTDHILAKLMASSQALTYLSYFEGFGIPLLEAMQCKIPIICSNKSSLPEVAGIAALSVDPFDINEICSAMLSISSDEDLRNQLINAGNEQLHKFSWAKTSKLLWQSIEKTLNN